MNTEIKKIKGSWEEVVDDCRATVGKPPLGHEPSEDFKRRILIAEHGPIRKRGPTPRTSRPSCMRSSRRLPMCSSRTVSIDVDARSFIRAGCMNGG